MDFLLFAAGCMIAVWALIVLVRGSVFLSTALFFVSTICIPAELFSVDAAGLTWTLDRVWFLVLLGQFTIQWYRGELKYDRLAYCDLAIGLFFLWLVARTVTQPLGSVLPEQPPTLMHLINGYAIPIAIYAVLRCTRLDALQLKPMLAIIVALGAYLGFTALFEIANLWALVFPRFIGDPELGIHFGRARGPMLQSVRLGICLVATWTIVAVYTVWLKPDCKVRWIGFSVATLVFGGAIFATYTRSVWLGFAFTMGLLSLLAMQGLPRRAVIFAGLLGCMTIGVLKGPDLVAFKREYSAAETRESTYMRAAFAYVSLEMFKERPISGYGFNQFQVYNRPYLSDRTTDIRVSSIRGYVHHNTFLSLLVDLGIVGLALYGFVLATLSAQAWALWRAVATPAWVRGIALVAFAVGGSHMLQMAFHEVSFSTIENSILFAVCGLLVSATQQYCVRSRAENVSRNESSVEATS